MARSKSPAQKANSVSPDPQAFNRARQAMENRSKKNQSFWDKYSYHVVIALFGLIMLWFMFSTFYKGGVNVHTTLVNDPDYISSINSQNNGFKVGAADIFQNYNLVDAKNLINNQASNKKQLYICNKGNKQTAIPDTFNFRQQYKQCARPIQNQGNCSSSYSIAPVSVINDRWCKTNPTQHPILSAQTPLACDKVINKGCKQGFVSRTLDYSKIYGLVQQSCLKYSTQFTAQQCQSKIQTCQKFKVADYCVLQSEEAMKQEIVNYGPVVAVIPVYRDFLIYQQGVYQVMPGTQKFSSGHAVKVIGWDVRNGQNCWLVENSWGEQWGQNGISCILMNQEQLGIERFSLAVALNNADIENTQQQVQGQINEEQVQQQEL